MPQMTGGWDVHTHIVPPGVVAAGGRGAFGMRASPDTLTICAHGVPLHPITEVSKLADRVKVIASTAQSSRCRRLCSGLI